MKAQWQQLNEKFLQLSTREIALIFISGLVLFFMLPFSFVIEKNLTSIQTTNKKISAIKRNNIDLDNNIYELSKALALDPNQVVKDKITQLEKRLAKVDEQLLTLTEELIDPIEMRQALIQLLKLQPGVSLKVFEVLPAEQLMFLTEKHDESTNEALPEGNEVKTSLNNTKTASSGLYRHGIRLTLNGKYFQLRDYLQQLEDLPWKFFWHDFHYQLKAYPSSELTIEIYSLSTNQEFVGV